MQFLMLVATLAAVLPTVAVAGTWPVPTSIKTQIFIGGSSTYTMTWALLELGPETEEPPREGYTKVVGGYRAPYDIADPNSEMFFWHAGGMNTTANTTIGEMARQAYENAPNGYTQLQLRYTVTSQPGVCIGYRVTRGGGHDQFDLTYAPGGTCVNAPPGPEWCSLISPALVFDHGSVSLTDAEGSQATDNLQVECTAGTTARLTLIGHPDGALALGGEGRAQLTADGRQLSEPVTLPAGPSDIGMTSTLHAVPVGTWVASGVLVLEPL